MTPRPDKAPHPCPGCGKTITGRKTCSQACAYRDLAIQRGNVKTFQPELFPGEKREEPK